VQVDHKLTKVLQTMDSFHLGQQSAEHPAHLAAGVNNIMGEKCEPIAGVADGSSR
jgi:hypothetical protein